MKILVALTYYRPHVSGLTIYVERLARSLVERGHDVTVLTSQYDPSLPKDDNQEGVRIRRVPVLMRVSKGVIMPTIGLEATREVAAHDAVSLHLPQLDAAGIALRGRLLRRPTLLTYHSDLQLPPGVVNRAADAVVSAANRLSGVLAHQVVAYTRDFATHSPFLSQHLHKLTVIPPPVEVAEPDKEFADHLAGLVKGRFPVIGMAARLATEKGVEHLLGALPAIRQRFPNAHVLFAGPYENVLGETEYARRLSPQLAAVEDCWSFLGTLTPAQMTAFYDRCDVTVLPSINNTETFGLVQIESMLRGTPVVASDLPGVRQPVMTTGMGKITPIGDHRAIAEAIIDVADHPERYTCDRDDLEATYLPGKVAEAYETLINGLFTRLGYKRTR
jgi:glycosyltransferase involved in cell wall biosynthesis